MAVFKDIIMICRIQGCKKQTGNIMQQNNGWFVPLHPLLCEISQVRSFSGTNFHLSNQCFFLILVIYVLTTILPPTACLLLLCKINQLLRGRHKHGALCFKTIK